MYIELKTNVVQAPSPFPLWKHLKYQGLILPPLKRRTAWETVLWDLAYLTNKGFLSLGFNTECVGYSESNVLQRVRYRYKTNPS